MKKLFLLSGVVALASVAQAQQLKEGYIEWPNSQGLAGYVKDWKDGKTLLNGDENFYISRVKPKARFRNTNTQINESLNDANDKKLIFWVPIDMASDNARPNGVFDSEVFSAWSYVTHYGNWTSPHGWVPGGFADVAHKNGVAVSGVASVPYGGISTDWNTALRNQTNLSNEDLAKFMHYHGVDGLGYNAEWSGGSTWLSKLRTQHEEVLKYLKEQGNPVAENMWYDGTNDNGSITFDQGLGSHNNETFGDGDHIRTSLFLNYNWNRVLNYLTQARVDAQAPGRSALDLYAGYNMQGSDPNIWTSLQSYPISIGLWGAHDYNMLWGARANKGSSDMSKQKTYQDILEMFFTNGNRNPAKPIAVYNGGVHMGTEDWFGMSAFMSARSSLKWDLGEEPFITFFNLGNGQFFNWKGVRQNANEWYNIGVQDYLPTWRFWFASKFLGKTAADVPATGLDAEFAFDDAYVGGSSLRIFGNTTDEYLHLFKTEFNLQRNDVITVRYKLAGGNTDLNLVLSAVGAESTILQESNLSIISSTDEADDEVWVEKQFKLTAALGAQLHNKDIAVIGLHFKNAANLSLYLGEFSITRGESTAPAAPVIASTTVLANHYKGVDAKLIFNMPHTKAQFEPVYNIDVNTSMFKLYAQQEDEEPIFMGITTSWAGMYYSIPTNLQGAQKIRLGVAAVSLDTKTDSEIAWGEYMDMGEYTVNNDIQINKTTIKPGEDFEISYVDAKHAVSDWKLYDGTTVKASASGTTVFSVPEGINEVGAYDLVIDEGTANERRINSYVQVTSWGVGALPKIETLTINGEENAPAEIKTGDKLTLGYTARQADGAASRGVEIDEKNVGVKVSELGIQPRQSFSVAAWVNFSTMPGGSSFFGIENRAGTWPVNNWGWMWSSIEGKNFCWTFRNDGAAQPGELQYSFPDLVFSTNAWNHVAMTFEYDGNRFRSLFYLNGVLQKSTWKYTGAAGGTGTTETWANNITYGIAGNDWISFGGTRGGNSSANTGIIDELQVWNKAMTQEDVTASYNGLNGNSLPADVIAYWDFDTNAGSDHNFLAKGSKAGAKASVFEMQQGESEGQSYQTPVEPKYISGCPFIGGEAYRIVTVPTWTAKRGVIADAQGTDKEGSATVSYTKAGDYTVTLTLENTLGYDQKNYPVFSVTPSTGIGDVNAEDLNIYTVDESLFVEFAEAGNYQVDVYNVAGAKVAEKAATVSVGQNMLITLGAKGVYVVNVQKDGKPVRAIKVLRK